MLKKIINFIIKKLSFFYILNLNVLNKLNIYINKESNLEIISITYNKSGRFLTFLIRNNKNLDHSDVIKAIFNTLMSSEDFLNFGYNKIIITSSIIGKSENSFHHNVLLNNKTIFEDYYNSIIDIVNKYYDEGYTVDVIPIFRVRV